MWVAKLKHSVGWLISSNRVLYPDAFTGIKADLICTYRRSGFESDLVLRQQPPPPDAYGLDATSSTLQMFTEFFNTADPVQTPSVDDPDYGITDATLKFGKLTMVRGKAFLFGVQTSNAVPVFKGWFHSEGRKFLVEQVPLDYIAEDLQTLPEATNILTSQILKDPILYVAQAKRNFPPARGIVPDTNQILVASADVKKEPGVVLDYDTVVDGDSGKVFSSGETYLVRGHMTLSGTTTINGGAVIKFDSGYYNWSGSGSGLTLTGPLTCNPGTGGPALLTDMNDNSVGFNLPGSSGYPGINEVPLIYVYNYESAAPWQLNNLKFCYTTLGFWADDNNDVVVRNSQFIQADTGVQVSNGDLKLENVLFAGGYTPAMLDSYGQTVTAENVTADGFYAFCDGASQITLRNCLLTYNAPVTISHGPDTAIIPSSSGIYQTGPLGNYYLATGSPHRNQGITPADAQWAAEIQGLTTYAPQDGGYLDTDTPDRGFHYLAGEDSNNNGLPDWWELNYFGNLNQAASGDYDGDGVNNLQEFLNHTGDC